MPDLAPNEAPTGSPKPGTLIAVVGPSGSGKDTLIAAARAHFAGHPDLVFVRRYVTRPTGAHEDCREVTPPELERLRADGGLFLSWQAHGLGYGVPRCVETDLLQGRTVVLNLSREMASAALARWPQTRFVQIAVPPDVLRARLAARRRESPADIEHRLRRAADTHLPSDRTTVLDNAGPLETAVRSFIDLLAPYAGPQSRDASGQRHTTSNG